MTIGIIRRHAFDQPCPGEKTDYPGADSYPLGPPPVISQPRTQQQSEERQQIQQQRSAHYQIFLNTHLDVLSRRVIERVVSSEGSLDRWCFKASKQAMAATRAGRTGTARRALNAFQKEFTFVGINNQHFRGFFDQGRDCMVDQTV